MLIFLINTFLPWKECEKSHKKNLHNLPIPPFKWSSPYCFLSRSFSNASNRSPRPSCPKLLTQLKKKIIIYFLIKYKTCKAISLLLLVHPFTGSTFGLTSQKTWSAKKANSPNKYKLLQATEKGEEISRQLQTFLLSLPRLLRALVSYQQALA